MRNILIIKEITFTKNQLLAWASKQDLVCILDSNSSDNQSFITYDYLIGIGAKSKLILKNTDQAFEKLVTYQQEKNDWLLGYLSYDCKNDIENLQSKNNDVIQFPELIFFQPQKIIYAKNNTIYFEYYAEIEEIKADIQIIEKTNFQNKFSQTINLKPTITFETYQKTVQTIQNHIQKGNIYELNYCIQFIQNQLVIDSSVLFLTLNEKICSPMTAYFSFNDYEIISFSPERFLQKKNQNLLAQPIKGTRKKVGNVIENMLLKQELSNSIKERSENIMIVDLIRNDLAIIANEVIVSELCGIYEFKNIIQMISTITAKIAPNITIENILKANFPMGSMTGAPKYKSLQLIEMYENFKRGVYSGALGYFSPNGDFDFNVVIRSFLYNKALNIISLSVGSAITAQANAQEEYEECLLKYDSVIKLL